MEVFKKIKYKDCIINVYNDDDAKSPNDLGDEDCFIVYNHRDFTVKRKDFHPLDIYYWLNAKDKLENDRANADIRECEITLEDYDFSGYYIFPVNAYIHSGIALSLTDSFERRGFDNSVTGMILVSKDILQQGSGGIEEDITKEEAIRYAENLIKTWNQYLSGEVYGYMIDTGDGVEQGGCWGYYGDEGVEQLEIDAKNEIDNGKVTYTFKSSEEATLSLEELEEIRSKYNNILSKPYTIEEFFNYLIKIGSIVTDSETTVIKNIEL